MLTFNSKNPISELHSIHLRSTSLMSPVYNACTTEPWTKGDNQSLSLADEIQEIEARLKIGWTNKVKHAAWECVVAMHLKYITCRKNTGGPRLC